jgi:hypothetical protein
MAPPEAKDSSRPDGGGDEDEEEIDESVHARYQKGFDLVANFRIRAINQ